MKPVLRFSRALFIALLLVGSVRPAFCQTTIPDTLTMLTCHHFWKTGVPMPGMITQWSIVGPQAVVTDAGDCKEFKFAPQTTFWNFCPYGSIASGGSNGVTVADLIKIANHILGIEPLQPAFLRFAADATNNGSITTSDVGEYYKLILGIYQELPNCRAWQSFSPDFVPTPPDNPFADPACTYLYDPAVTRDTIDLNAFKQGDVDGDANPSGPYIVPQNLPAAMLSLPDWILQAGDTVSVPLYMNVNESVGGFQAGFTLDPALGNFLGLDPGLFSEDLNHIAIFPGAMTTAQVNLPPTAVIPTEPVFYLKVKANQTFSVKDALKMSSQITPALWVDTTDNVRPFGPELTTRLRPEPVGGVRVFPPSPNPFHDRTMLQIDLDHATDARLEISDVAGRMLGKQACQLQAGTNRLEISGELMHANSLAFYHLYTSEWSVSGKLIRQ